MSHDCDEKFKYCKSPAPTQIPHRYRLPWAIELDFSCTDDVVLHRLSGLPYFACVVDELYGLPVFEAHTGCLGWIRQLPECVGGPDRVYRFVAVC